jgi:hypothetical protein
MINFGLRINKIGDLSYKTNYLLVNKIKQKNYETNLPNNTVCFNDGNDLFTKSILDGN